MSPQNRTGQQNRHIFLEVSSQENSKTPAATLLHSSASNFSRDFLCGNLRNLIPEFDKYNTMLSPVGAKQPNAKNQMALVPADRKWKPGKLLSGFRSVFRLLTKPTSPCRWMAFPGGPSEFRSVGNRVTGTLFGHRKGHVHLAVQENPKSAPFLLLELATPTSTLVKEMASGLVRIALECEKTANRGKLFQEPVWEMYCNGRKTGYGMKRSCTESDVKILNIVQAVSMGAGVIPTDEEGSDGELMYMRARFERVVGSKDSEAFYMMNPDGSGPELSIFMLRI